MLSILSSGTKAAAVMCTTRVYIQANTKSTDQHCIALIYSNKVVLHVEIVHRTACNFVVAYIPVWAHVADR